MSTIATTTAREDTGSVHYYLILQTGPDEGIVLNRIGPYNKPGQAVECHELWSGTLRDLAAMAERKRRHGT